MFASAVAAVALLATSVVGQTSTFNSLAADRNASRFSTFLPFNADQREALLSQVEVLLGQAWVNYESKLINYGPPADPFPIIRDLRANIATVSDADLQLRLSDAFIGLRDLHTSFFMAGPHRCFSATTGLFFELIDSDDIAKNPRVAVLRKDERPLVSFLGPDFAKVAVGDELLTINGDSFATWFEKNQFKSGAGANLYGGHRAAIGFLNFVPGSVNRLPAEDTITFTFKSRATGQTYPAVINYATSRNNACWNLNINLYRTLTGKTLPGATAVEAERASKMPAEAFRSASAGRAGASGSVIDAVADIDPFKRPMERVEVPYLENKKEALGDLELGPVKLNPTSVPIISWGIWDPNGRNLGVLRLDDFSPPNDAAGIEVIRGLLVKELKDTNAIMIDLRENGGGSVNFANNIPQLFKADFEPFGGRYLYNDVMKRTFVDRAAPTDSWRLAYEKTKPGSKYTEFGFFNTPDQVNDFGQVYLKPVGILNNGGCYSACDRLSASWQNAGNGPVFGEDGQTGAGGANVLQHSALQTRNPTDFKALPFVANLTSGTSIFGNRMSVGIRQGVRNGAYNGVLIEDLGVKADYVVRARVEDILPGTTTSSQFDRIGDALIEEGKKTGKAGLGFLLEPFILEIPAGRTRLSPEISGLEELTIVNAAGRRVATRRDLFAGVGGKRQLPIEVAPVVSGLGNGQLTILGKKAGKSFLKTNRFVRTVPTDAERVDLTKGPYNWDLNVSPAIGVYNLGLALRTPAAGWNKGTAGWQINDGVSYGNGVDSTLQHFFTAPVGSRLSIRFVGAYDTEPLYDFLAFNVVDAAGRSTPLIRSAASGNTQADGVSGKADLNRTFTFTTTSQKFSVAIRFTSDGEVPGGAVVLTQFSVTIAPPA